jgi:hypothetical protein
MRINPLGSQLLCHVNDLHSGTHNGRGMKSFKEPEALRRGAVGHEQIQHRVDRRLREQVSSASCSFFRLLRLRQSVG